MSQQFKATDPVEGITVTCKLLEPRIVVLSFISKTPCRINEYVEARVGIDDETIHSLSSWLKKKRKKKS